MGMVMAALTSAQLAAIHSLTQRRVILNSVSNQSISCNAHNNLTDYSCGQAVIISKNTNFLLVTIYLVRVEADLDIQLEL